MKKNILILTCIFTTLAHAMETVSLLGTTDSSLKLLCYDTPINLIRDSERYYMNGEPQFGLYSHSQLESGFGLNTLLYSLHKSIVPTPKVDQSAPIAIAAIFDAMHNNPKAFTKITFSVETSSAFTLYKKLLMEYYKPIKAICLLRCAYTQQDGSFLTVPREIMDCITRLMYNS